MARRAAGKPAKSISNVADDPADGRIVSSAHLVSAKVPELSEMEFGMIHAWHAF